MVVILETEGDLRELILLALTENIKEREFNFTPKLNNCISAMLRMGIALPMILFNWVTLTTKFVKLIKMILMQRVALTYYNK